MYSIINVTKVVSVALLTLLGTKLSVAAPAPQSKNAETANKVSVFATIGKEQISWPVYQVSFDKEVRNKLFHDGKPSDEVIAKMQRSVADRLIADALVLNEAKRRKLKPDNEAVEQELTKFEAKMAKDASWSNARDKALPGIKKRIQDENLVKKLEVIVRTIPTPRDAEVKAYYEKHPEKFTTPKEQRVSVILLPVDPSSTTDGWVQTMADANGLAKRIREGEDFAAMAKLYSKDAETVDDGGDMGYMHEGMMPEQTEELLGKLEIGGVTEASRLLEGVAIFKLTDRRQTGVSSYDSVKQRASDLLLAEKSDTAWTTFMAELKKKTPMNIDESRFLPLASSSTPSSEEK